MKPIPGMAPNLLDMPKGCVFSPRCPYATDLCRTKAPETTHCEVGFGKCYLYEGTSENGRK